MRGLLPRFIPGVEFKKALKGVDFETGTYLFRNINNLLEDKYVLVVKDKQLV